MSRTALPFVLCVLLFSCSSPEEYKEDADKEVASILKSKQEAIFDEADSFSIDWNPRRLNDFAEGATEKGGTGKRASRNSEPEEERVDLKAWDGPEVTLSLRDALFMATHNSRDYQTRKEDVYLSALSLSLERHQWDFLFSGDISGTYVREGDDYYTTGDSSLGFTKLLSEGGSIGLTIGTNFLRYVSGDPRQSFISSVSMAFSQPLLRGAGRTVAREALTQAERNTIYSLRGFRRFRQTFAIAVTSDYYRVLQQKDTLRNEVENYNSLLRSLERTEELATAGRLPEFEVDQARQDTLRARDRWIRAQQRFERAIDDFKITLGLRTDANITLDTREFDVLKERGLEDVPILVESSSTLAFSERTDFINSVDDLEDARRKVVVAEDGFLAELNLVGGADFGSEGPNNVANLRPRDGTYTVGLDVDLALDRKRERNLYRQALITLDRTRRQLQEDADLIKFALRNSFRALEQARKSYDIQRLSAVLAVRRVESTNMLLEAGDATIRDLLEAQAADLEAKNAVTGALIDYNVERLECFGNMGILAIDDLGMWACPEAAELEERLVSARLKQDNQGE
jgi:outer membrane protein TolC